MQTLRQTCDQQMKEKEEWSLWESCTSESALSVWVPSAILGNCCQHRLGLAPQIPPHPGNNQTEKKLPKTSDHILQPTAQFMEHSRDRIKMNEWVLNK